MATQIAFMDYCGERFWYYADDASPMLCIVCERPDKMRFRCACCMGIAHFDCLRVSPPAYCPDCAERD